MKRVKKQKTAYNSGFRRGVLDKYIFETIDQVREQTEI